MFGLNEKYLNSPECEQFERQCFNHEFKYEQNDSFGRSHDHSHHSDQSKTSIMNTSLSYCPHLEQGRRSSDPGVCVSDGGGGGSLLWQRSSRQDSFSQPSVSAPVVVVSQSTWEPTHSQSPVASHSLQHEILLPDVSNQLVSGLLKSMCNLVILNFEGSVLKLVELFTKHARVNWKIVAVSDHTVLILSGKSNGCNAFKKQSAHCTLLNFFRADFVECFEQCYCQI